MTQISSAPSSSACSAAISTASKKLSHATAPAASNEESRVSTRFSRPGRGRIGRLSQVLRPMMQGLDRVICLNRFRSDRSRHGRSPSRPITPFRARATTRDRGIISGRVLFQPVQPLAPHGVLDVDARAGRNRSAACPARPPPRRPGPAGSPSPRARADSRRCSAVSSPSSSCIFSRAQSPVALDAVLPGVDVGDAQDRGGQLGKGHTATAALMCGHGS